MKVYLLWNHSDIVFLWSLLFICRCFDRLLCTLASHHIRIQYLFINILHVYSHGARSQLLRAYFWYGI